MRVARAACRNAERSPKCNKLRRSFGCNEIGTSRSNGRGGRSWPTDAQLLARAAQARRCMRTGVM